MWEGCRCPEGDLSGDLYSNANGLRRERERGGEEREKQVPYSMIQIPNLLLTRFQHLPLHPISLVGEPHASLLRPHTPHIHFVQIMANPWVSGGPVRHQRHWRYLGERAHVKPRCGFPLALLKFGEHNPNCPLDSPNLHRKQRNEINSVTKYVKEAFSKSGSDFV